MRRLEAALELRLEQALEQKLAQKLIFLQLRFPSLRKLPFAQSEIDSPLGLQIWVEANPSQAILEESSLSGLVPQGGTPSPWQSSCKMEARIHTCLAELE